MIIVSAVTLCLVAISTATPTYQLSHEWHAWKSKHRKSYISNAEELERHLIWLSNKKYIEGHNANNNVFGYSLSMNQFGDMVSCRVGPGMDQ